MAKVKVDSVLRAENIKGATKDNPAIGKIVSVNFIDVKDLPFKTEDGEGKWEMSVLIGDDGLQWMPNKTSLKSFIAKWADESDEWIGKEVSLYSVTQNVGGEMKNVVYGEAR